MYTTYHIAEYLPKRYAGTFKQIQDRQMCYDFKNGLLIDYVKQSFLDKLELITYGEKKNWVICFIPASTQNKTDIRFRDLANALETAGYQVERKAIFNAYDKESDHLTIKSDHPAQNFGYVNHTFKGRRIVLIDDIITRGRTFREVAEHLTSLGATTVIGLFLAKTINPDFVKGIAFDCPYEDYETEDDYDEPTYDCYHGSYAQDVEGWSDQDIDNVFDGDPDAYWNID